MNNLGRLTLYAGIVLILVIVDDNGKKSDNWTWTSWYINNKTIEQLILVEIDYTF